MAMLRLEQESFSTGRAPFKDHHPGGKETTARVYVEVAIQGIKESSFLALVDTGAPLVHRRSGDRRRGWSA